MDTPFWYFGDSDAMKSSSSSPLGTHRSFLLHKPIDVLSSTVDSHITDTVRNHKSSRKHEFSEDTSRQRMGGAARLTVYDVAQKAGFPTNLGLVGRLDYATSGVILFTSDSRLQCAILHPLDHGSDSAVDTSESNDANDAGEDDEIDIIDGGSQHNAEGYKDEEWYNTLRLYKQKEYELVLLCPRKYQDIDELRADLPRIASALIEPFSFQRSGRQFHTNSDTRVEITSYGQDPAHAQGRPDLGWSITVKVTLTEGKHHQIRRMARRSRFCVLALKRLRIARILDIESVPQPGDCRWLTDEEVQQLQTHLVEPYFTLISTRRDVLSSFQSDSTGFNT